MQFHDFSPFASSFSSIVVSEIGDKVLNNTPIDLFHYCNYVHDLFNGVSIYRILFGNGFDDSIILFLWIHAPSIN